MSKTKVAVLGAGSWGTALAHHLKRAGHEVTIWGRDEEVLASIAKDNQNPAYFPNIQLTPGIKTEKNVTTAVANAQLVVIAVPSTGVRGVANAVRLDLLNDVIVVSTAKGLEEGSLKSMSVVLQDELPAGGKVAVLSGPSFAQEVIRGLPTAVTMAAKEEKVAEKAARYFHFDNLRIYTSTDVIGVEFGGVVKNVIALAAGVVDGVGMGANARAALITRGLAEMQRLIVALGGDRITLMGLSGLGDLIVTATSDQSRNRQVGLRLGRGEKLEEIVSSLGQTAEAVKTTNKVLALSRKLNVEMPIVEEVDKVLTGKSTVKESVYALLARAPGAEK